MDKEILYTTALNKNGELIRIGKAEKGETYYCPLCKTEFILKKSGKTGKGSKRAHFAHVQLTTNCTPEGVLHHSFKKFLIGFLEKYRSECKALIVSWNCNACHAYYSNGNLMVKTAKIEEEYNLKVCRPDIALLDSEGNVVAAIEIVVTHEPEVDVLSYYERNGITLIQINLFSEEDLDRVEEKIAYPDFVNFCLNPKCSNFRNHNASRKLIVSDERCKRCGQSILNFHVEVSSVFGTNITNAFTENEIRSAQLMGVRFKMMEDKTSKEKYPVINCLTCEINDKRMRIYDERMRSKYRRRPL